MSDRTPIVVGNWKMHTDRATAPQLAGEVARGAGSIDGVQVGVCPPFVYLAQVVDAVAALGTGLLVGGQDVWCEPEGAYTGEISAAMLRDVGAGLVIVGHSERRHVLGEPDELVGEKAHAALDEGLTCIVCVGETLDERQAGRADDVNRRQLDAALSGVEPADLDRLVIAYEPVWAIGTGNTATPGDAQAAHAAIRRVLIERFGAAAAGIRIQYGGSIKPGNAAELFAQPDIDGGLIGGASLKADDFLAIVRAAAGAALH